LYLDAALMGGVFLTLMFRLTALPPGTGAASLIVAAATAASA
jgi:hypothetical protein